MAQGGDPQGHWRRAVPSFPTCRPSSTTCRMCAASPRWRAPTTSTAPTASSSSCSRRRFMLDHKYSGVRPGDRRHGRGRRHRGRRAAGRADQDRPRDHRRTAAGAAGRRDAAAAPAPVAAAPAAPLLRPRPRPVATARRSRDGSGRACGRDVRAGAAPRRSARCSSERRPGCRLPGNAAARGAASRNNARRPFRLRPSAPTASPFAPRARAMRRACCWSRASDCRIAHVLDLPDILRPGDVLVFNDTRVIPAQLEGRRGEARVGATLHKREGLRELVGLRPQRQAGARRRRDRVRRGGEGQRGRRATSEGAILLHFHGEEPVELLLERAGQMPLPPYIAGKRPTDEADRDDYQTMFAREAGAVAAPTAALHFTDRLIAALDERGREARDADPACRRGHLPAGQGRRYRRATGCTANGAGSTRPTADRLNAARAAGGRLIAVGTTSLRLIESAADEAGHDPAVRGRYGDLHHARLSLQGGRRADDQFPPAEIDAVHAGQRADGARRDEGGLCPCHRAAAIASTATATARCCCPRR